MDEIIYSNQGDRTLATCGWYKKIGDCPSGGGCFGCWCFIVLVLADRVRNS